MTQQWMTDAVANERQEMLKIARAIVRHYGNAEELTQAVCLSALEQIAAGKVRATSEEKFRAWLFTILRRNAMRRAGQPGGDGDTVPTAGERNLRHAFREIGGEASRFTCAPGYDGPCRTIGRSKRRPSMSESEQI